MSLLATFFRGIRVAPVLCTGFTEDGTEAWNVWSTDRAIDPWSYVGGWFPLNTEEKLSGLAARFFELLSDEAWNDVLKRAISFYTASLRPSFVQLGVITTQAALELLFWVTFVETNKRISKSGFRKIDAKDQMRLLLTEASIPLDLPDGLDELIRVGKKNSFTTGPEALTFMRSRVVHPDTQGQLKNIPPGAIIQAWALGNWYLELSLLHLLQYDGEYHNRLKGGFELQKEPVPWAKT